MNNEKHRNKSTAAYKTSATKVTKSQSKLFDSEKSDSGESAPEVYGEK